MGLGRNTFGYIKRGEYRDWPPTYQLVNKARDLGECSVLTELLHFCNALSRFRVEAW